jgi:hypothetical protein
LRTFDRKNPLTRLLNIKSELRNVARGNQTARRLANARSAASINLVAQHGKSNRKIDFLNGDARRNAKPLAPAFSRSDNGKSAPGSPASASLNWKS